MAGIVPYTHEVEACVTGAGGLGRADFESVLEEAGPAVEAIRRWLRERCQPFLALPGARDDLAGIEAVAQRHREAFELVVVLGTGGSSLGGQSLVAVEQPAFPGIRPGPRVLFMENIDPHSFAGLLRAADLGHTGFIAISRSGETAEALAQFSVCRAAMREAIDGDRLARHFTVVTKPGSNPLRRMAEAMGVRVLDHDPKLGGRFSALSITGLLPATIAGVDALAARAGAQAVLDGMLGAAGPGDCAPAVGAAISIGLLRARGIGATVLMPYCDRLAPFARWFRQLWAESLGKDGNGTTPIASMGTVDQHSQLQLYLDGPADKMFTILTVAPGADDLPMPRHEGAGGEPGWLAGRTMGALLQASARATAEALTARGRPVRAIHLAKLDAASIGAMMMHFMLETVIAAHLLGVDPFDQPAVEQGKALTRDLVGAEPTHEEA